ncbi:hypothetical protein V1282_002058 [Nitrobacteraceae bacterium AZCC 2146]
MTRAIYDKPQKGNPHRLVIRQHVFPSASIKRFANEAGSVYLADLNRNIGREAKPEDDIFCAKRAWHESVETGMFKRIEDRFQTLADFILERGISAVTQEQAVTISDFYALWYMRARRRSLSSRTIKLIGIHGGGGLSLDQEEMLEKNGYVFARNDGEMPARHINGVRLQMHIQRYARQIIDNSQWGVVQSIEGEFIVPDRPEQTVIPLAPDIAMVSPAPCCLIRRDDLVKINQFSATNAVDYLFARSLSKCPLF